MPNPVTLKVFRGDELVRSERFTREIIKIGRMPSAHLCLDDDRISRIHSVIEVTPEGSVSIIDMGSTEGTFVNGRRVTKGPLRAGDEIKLGGLRIVVDGEDLAARPNRAVGVPGPTPLPSSAGAANGTHGANGAGGHATNGAHGNGIHGSGGATRAPGVHVTAANAADLTRVAVPTATASELRLAAVSVGARLSAAVAVPLPAPEPPAPEPAPRAPRPAMALARPVDDEPAEDGAPELGVELRVLWGETLLDAGTFVQPRHPVLVGEDPRCHFRLSGPDLPSAAFPLLRFDGGEYRFAFTAALRGGVDDGSGFQPFTELVKARRATPDEGEGSWSVAVPRAGVVQAQLGSGLRIEARHRRPPRPAEVPWWSKLDYRYLNLLLVLLFLQGAFIVAAKTTTRDVDLVQDDLAKGQQRMAKFVIKPPEAKPKPNPYLEKLKADLKKDPGEMAERHRNEEGQMGKRDAPKTNRRSAPRAIDPNAKELVKNSGLLAAIGKGKGQGGLSTVFGQGGLGGDLKGAIGNMYGPAVGDSYGVGGLGLKGNGTGGGGSGDTIGIGAVGTKGRGGGLGGYGSGVGGLGSKRDRDIAIATGDTRVLGAIDPELVRKVIRDHADQVRYCYEQQLTLNPKLAGKVAIRWQINANGFSSNTTLDPANPIDSEGLQKVAACIMSRIVTWEFPKPKGGGMAIVTYPWILRSSGSTSGG